jgi:signal transduction histidine kinase
MIVQLATLTKLQLGAATLSPALTDAETTSPAAVAASLAEAKAKRARGLIAAGHARIGNSWLRLGSSAIVAVVAASLLNNLWAFVWLAGLVFVILGDRAIYKSVLRRSLAGDPPRNLGGVVAWTAAQSAYGNIMAALLWFAPYVPGETLAVIYICGGLANSAATLRSNPALSIAGIGPTIATMLGLPLAEYAMNGANNPLDLMPLVGGLLLLGFGVNLWKSLLASDAAQAQAEASAMRERQAAAAAAAAKTDTIRRMNDELRTPMAALVGAAEHLHRAAANPQARAHIATIVQAGEVLKMVLDDLSDLDNLENGQLRIEAKPTDPRDLARGVVAAFKTAATDKNLELFLDIAPDVPARVALDPARVRQVLFNLLANAVRYTTHGGVRVRVSVLSTEANRARLNFAIVDTGAGMSRSQLAQIFGRAKLCMEGEGPGLGLTISLRLAKLMGGQINAKSDIGQGSMFAFTLDAPVLVQTASSPVA